jgi:hypothetical protein
MASRGKVTGELFKQNQDISYGHTEGFAWSETFGGGILPVKSHRLSC